MPETGSQKVRKRIPYSFHVVDDRRQHSSGRMMLKEIYGLPHDFRVHLIPKIGDACNSRIVHQRVPEVFGNPLADKHNNNCDGEQGPHAMNLARKKGV